ncbi:MAG: radical SAM protein [Treponema sp.]|uniref:radical SAM protein n=1 Tax=Treponema sp. TaxID=166 RepID=UPI003FA26E3E
MQTNLTDSITLLLKLVGTSCNMNCAYCYEYIESKKNQNENFYKLEEVKNFLSRYRNFKHIYIIFHGGEPLLTNIRDIKLILEHIKNTFTGTFNIQFQTNGTLLNDEWIDLFKQYEPNISLSVSLDPLGVKDLRKAKNFNYREKVINNLRKYSGSIKNIGVISVAHKFNIDFFISFIYDLIEIGIKALTINKCRFDAVYENNYTITERQFVDFLKDLTNKYISNKLYEKIRIQPILSLFQKKNKLCIYLADKDKCTYFCTFFNSKHCNILCDHINNGVIPTVPEKCLICDIYAKCGAGCLVEIKDDTFCKARHDLFKFIREVKHENYRFTIK